MPRTRQFFGSLEMGPFFKMIVKDRDGDHHWVEDLGIADFGGVEPKAGDVYCQIVTTGGQRHQQAFRVLCRVFKEQRIGLLMEWVDDLPEDLITVLEDR
jgi:hypothetical protein